MRAIGVGVVALAMIMAGLGPVRAAETTEASDDRVILGEVVVTASREKETAAKVPAHVTVIDAGDIEKSNARNVPEVLATAGLHVSDISGNQRSYAVDLRGFGESAPANLLVLVDGRRINQADLSGTDWTLIPLNRIERIEVVPGPRGSVLYGDNATGGVINIITKEGGGLAAKGEVQYGSYDTFKGAVGASGATDHSSYDIRGSYLNSDGYRDNSHTEAKDIGATFRLDPVEFVRLSFSTSYHNDDTGLPGALKQSDFEMGKSRTDTLNPDNFADTEDYYAKVGAEFFFLSDDVFRLDTTYRRRTVSQYSNFFGGGSFRGDSAIDTITVSPQLTFQESFNEVSNRVVLGSDFIFVQENITNTGGDSSDLDKANIGYYINDDLGVTRHLTFSGGYRRDRAVFDLSTYALNYNTFLRESRSSRPTMNEEAYSFGVNYALDSAKVYASYGKNFRYPLLDEFFSYPDFDFNVGLQPQASVVWEVGTKYDMTAHLALAINLFNIKTSNEIFLDPASYTNINLDGDTLRQGFEVQLSYRRGGWRGSADYTMTDATIIDGGYDGSDIPNVPKHLASASVSYTFDFGLLLGLNGVYVGQRPFISDFENRFDKQDDYTVINAKAGYTWRWLEFFVDFNNIFDTAYSSFGVIGGTPEERAYYPSPEFNVIAGVTVRFGGK